MTSLLIMILSTFYLGMLGMLINRLHFLSILLCLELLLMSLFLGFTIWSFKLKTHFLFSKKLILLTLSACETSAGLSLMVALSRSHNSDLVSQMNMLQH